MVKGISRQVIVVRSPETELFEQAIFFLKDGAVGKEGITDEELLKQARQAIRSSGNHKASPILSGPVWACGGAAATGLIWLITLLL